MIRRGNDARLNDIRALMVRPEQVTASGVALPVSELLACFP